jgi:exoribonuclease II
LILSSITACSKLRKEFGNIFNNLIRFIQRQMALLSAFEHTEQRKIQNLENFCNMRDECDVFNCVLHQKSHHIFVIVA